MIAPVETYMTIISQLAARADSLCPTKIPAKQCNSLPFIIIFKCRADNKDVHFLCRKCTFLLAFHFIWLMQVEWILVRLTTASLIFSCFFSLDFTSIIKFGNYSNRCSEGSIASPWMYIDREVYSILLCV